MSAILFVLITVGAAAQAQAYLDPGTGSYILQIVLAGFLASLYTLKLYWAKIKAYFTKADNKSTKEDQD